MGTPRRSIAAVLLAVSLPGLAAAQDPLPAWRLSARPTLAIGGEGNPRTEFLRVGTVLRLANGDIVVPNAGTSQVRIFDRAGRYLRALGRSGSGPGEFANLNLVGRAGDTLLIADYTAARITLFLASGPLVRTIPITARDPQGRFSVLGRLRDGRWAVRTASTPNIYGPQRTYRDTVRVGVIAPDASGTVTWLGEFPGTTFFVHNPTRGPHGDAVGIVPLAPRSHSVVAGDEILVGDPGSNVIGAYSSAGTVLRLITLPLSAKPLTDERIARSGDGRWRGTRVNGPGRTSPPCTPDPRWARRSRCSATWCRLPTPGSGCSRGPPMPMSRQPGLCSTPPESRRPLWWRRPASVSRRSGRAMSWESTPTGMGSRPSGSIKSLRGNRSDVSLAESDSPTSHLPDSGLSGVPRAFGDVGNFTVTHCQTALSAVVGARAGRTIPGSTDTITDTTQGSSRMFGLSSVAE